METLFDWPTPPYFAFASGSEKTGLEACLIYLLDGNKALGNLIRFSPDESSLIFQPTRSDINETIGLNQIKSMRLVRPLVLRREEIALEAHAQEIFPPSDRQAYTVKCADNQIMEGETVLPAALSGGMRTLKQDELAKVLQGRTDVAQVRAVCV